ncbi:MAG: hypothetical protein AB7W16_08050 [Candidatus Obscuribacterales bacterium]
MSCKEILLCNLPLLATSKLKDFKVPGSGAATHRQTIVSSTPSGRKPVHTRVREKLGNLSPASQAERKTREILSPFPGREKNSGNSLPLPRQREKLGKFSPASQAERKTREILSSFPGRERNSGISLRLPRQREKLGKFSPPSQAERKTRETLSSFPGREKNSGNSLLTSQLV